MQKEAKEGILYLEPFSGISGDMFLGALLDLGLNEDWIRKTISEVLPDRTEINIWKDRRGAIRGTRFAIECKEKPKAKHLSDILDLLDSSGLEKEIVNKAKDMFKLIGEVEAGIHGLNKEEIHFHEVGATDSIADIVGAAAGMWKLSPEIVCSSPVNAGSGSVMTAHGELPVPAPATAELLRRKEVPTYSENTKAELTTPTGALILATFVDSYARPPFQIRKIGYGLGSKELEEKGNFLRISLAKPVTKTGPTREVENCELIMETNIDDMNSEILPVVEQKLLNAEALDVFETPIKMKKNRNGIKLSVICNCEDEDNISEIIFRETTTLGLRIHRIKRAKLNREVKVVDTQYGKVEVKIGYLNGEPVNYSPEFESCLELAENTDTPLKLIYQEAVRSALDEFR